MNHHAVSNVNSHMACAGSVVGALKENQVAGLCFVRWDMGTGIEKPCCGGSPHASHARLIDDPAHKARTIKGSGGRRTAPNIGVA